MKTGKKFWLIPVISGIFICLSVWIATSIISHSTKGNTYDHWYLTQEGSSELFSSEKHSYSSPTDSRALYHSIVERLISAPSDPDLRTVFPSDVKLRSVELRNSTLVINFSSEFVQMSDMEQTVARYCIAKTVTCFDSVSELQFLIEGNPLYGLSNSHFSVHDCVDSYSDLYPRTAEIVFYRADNGMSGLASEMESVQWYTHQSLPAIVAESLIENDSSALYPPGTTVSSVHSTEDTVYLELSVEFASLHDEEGKLAVYSIVNTLASIPDVTYVVISLNGERSSIGGIPLDEPLLPDMSYVNHTKN